MERSEVPGLQRLRKLDSKLKFRAKLVVSAQSEQCGDDKASVSAGLRVLHAAPDVWQHEFEGVEMSCTKVEPFASSEEHLGHELQ